MPKARKSRLVFDGEVYRVDDRLAEDGNPLSGNPHWYEHKSWLMCRACGQTVACADSLHDSHNGSQPLTQQDAEKALAEIRQDCQKGLWSRWFQIDTRCDCVKKPAVKSKAVQKAGPSCRKIE